MKTLLEVYAESGLSGQLLKQYRPTLYDTLMVTDPDFVSQIVEVIEHSVCGATIVQIETNEVINFYNIDGTQIGDIKHGLEAEYDELNSELSKSVVGNMGAVIF